MEASLIIKKLESKHTAQQTRKHKKNIFIIKSRDHAKKPKKKNISQFSKRIGQGANER